MADKVRDDERDEEPRGREVGAADRETLAEERADDDRERPPDPMRAEIVPYWARDTRSGGIAWETFVAAAIIVWKAHQRAKSIAKPEEKAIATRAAAHVRAERMIHGARGPSRDFVRSDTKPHRGLAMRPRTPPAVIIDARSASFSPEFHSRI